MTIKKPVIELLAPAGSFETFRAVLHAGADAVYLAGNRYGARAYAGNLSDEELLLAIDEAHIFGRRLYLTVNTLCKESELGEELLDYIRPLYEAGLDGVIVQDLGVLAFFSEHFPGLELHASTQMTITNSDFVPLLKKYGVTRIVPARELSLEEIDQLHRESGLEIECFVHGALCYCYSGECFMSSFLGGRSGNRGRCAQPCRLPYTKDNRCSNLISLKDLNTLQILPKLIEHGVYSMKIEGRMKSTEYAAGITEIYRKYIDRYLRTGGRDYQVDPEDLKHLLLLFDRGGITQGYYEQHNGRNMIAEETKSDKSQTEKKEYEAGVLERHGNTLCKIPVSMKASLYSGQNASLTLSCRELSVTVSGEEVAAARNRAMTKEEVVKQLSKLGGTYYEAKAIEIEIGENIFIPNGQLNELRRQAVDRLTEKLLAPFRRCYEGPTESEIETENAQRLQNAQPAENTQIEENAQRLQNAQPAENTQIEENAQRLQNAQPAESTQIEENARSTENRYKTKESKPHYAGGLSCHVMTPEQAKAVLSHSPRAARLILDSELLESREILEVIKENEDKEEPIPLYLGFPRIIRDEKKNHWKEFLAELGGIENHFAGFLCRSYGQIQEAIQSFPKADIITDFTCYAFNSRAALEICEAYPQIISQTYPIELNFHEMKGLGLVSPEIYSYGYLPLMVSANCVDNTCGNCHAPKGRFTEMTDRKKQKLPVLTCCRYCYNLIYNSLPLYICDRKEELERIDHAYLGIHFTLETAEESEAILSTAELGLPLSASAFTRGHLTKGVE